MMGIPSDIAYLKNTPPHYSDFVSGQVLTYFRTEMQDACPCWMLLDDTEAFEGPDSRQLGKLNGGNGRTPGASPRKNLLSGLEEYQLRDRWELASGVDP
jgi:hypothetical protein